MFARLSRLSLPGNELDDTTKPLDATPTSGALALKSVPALDIVVEDLELRGKHLGRVEVMPQIG